MSKPLSRREVLKLGGLALGSAALASMPSAQSQTTILPYEYNPFPLYAESGDYGRLARVTVREIDLHANPNDTSEIIGKRNRDQLIHIYYDLIPEDAPKYYNKLWYRVWGGYLHSSYLQLVEIRFNQPVSEVRASGQLAEVSVPYTQSFSYDRYKGWLYEYRLYYETTHWITGIDAGPDGKAWYRITDELQPFDYFVPAEHMRLVPDEEFAPISPDVQDKRIEVELASQTLRAFEGDNLVLETKISSGIPNRVAAQTGTPSETPRGDWRIYSKMPSKHMGDGSLFRGDLDLEAYELVGVPWTMFFHRLDTGYALHGTYWHNNFGWQMSHGCVNMRNQDAKWLFRWSLPVSDPTEVETNGYGTRVRVY